MEIIYYTIAALVLYGLSDYILNAIEIKMGKRLPSRSFIFLVIITILALASFSLMRALFSPLESTQQVTTQTQKPQQAPIPAHKNILPTNKETKN